VILSAAQDTEELLVDDPRPMAGAVRVIERDRPRGAGRARRVRADERARRVSRSRGRSPWWAETCRGVFHTTSATTRTTWTSIPYR